MCAGRARKKLKAAARLIATGRLDTVQWTGAELTRLLADLAFFGAPPEALAAARARFGGEVGEPVLAIHPANATAVRLFLAVQSQWRVVGLSTSTKAIWVRTGLDYGVLGETARLAGLELGDGDFDRLRILETEALVAWAEERERAA